MEEERTRRLEWAEHDQSEGVEDDFRTPDGANGNLIAQASGVDQPVAYVSLGLTVGDGFKFGCGFALAVAIAALVLVVVASVVFLVASVMGVPVPIR